MGIVYEELVENFGFSAAQRIIIGLVKTGEVLEVGASSGYLTKEFQKNGATVDAVELDPNATRRNSIARKVIIGSIEDENIQNQITRLHDFIICADVLKHLVNPDQALLYLKTRLRENGQIIISIPNVACWGMRITLLRGRFDYAESGLLDKTHLRFYTYDGFLELLERLSIHIVHVFPAETRIPLEFVLKKVPGINFIVHKWLKPFLVSKYPNLSVTHYVVQATI